MAFYVSEWRTEGDTEVLVHHWGRIRQDNIAEITRGFKKQKCGFDSSLQIYTRKDSPNYIIVEQRKQIRWRKEAATNDND